jgi:hypothetical protein
VGLHFLSQLVPVKVLFQGFFFLSVVVGKFPAVVVGVDELFMSFGCLVEQLFGDASDVDACSSQSPFGLVGAGLDKVDHDDAQPLAARFEGSRHASRPSSDDCQIIQVIVFSGTCLWVLEEGESKGNGGGSSERAFDRPHGACIRHEPGYFLSDHINYGNLNGSLNYNWICMVSRSSEDVG